MLFLVIGAVCIAFILGAYAAFVLLKKVNKPVAQPARAIPTEAFAHVTAHVGTVSVTSVHMVENPTKDTEPEPSGIDGAAIESEQTTSIDDALGGTRIPIYYETESEQPLDGAPSLARGGDDGDSALAARARRRYGTEAPGGVHDDDDNEANNDTSAAATTPPARVSPGGKVRQPLAL